MIKEIIKYKHIFSQMIANPSIAKDFQDLLSDISALYPWFVIPKIIKISLSNNIERKRTIINTISLNLYANNYYTLQSSSVNTAYTQNYLFLEKAYCDGSVKPSMDEINNGTVIFESNWSENDIFPKGRIVVTPSGLFYSEETEAYKIIKEVIAVNQKIDKNGKKISFDKTSEIIDIFLDKKVERIIPKSADIKSDTTNLSIIKPDEIVTESMAKIYRMQGLNLDAISIYEKLSLKYPEKFRYFTGIISSIRDEIAKTNNNK